MCEQFEVELTKTGICDHLELYQTKFAVLGLLIKFGLHFTDFDLAHLIVFVALLF